MLKFCAYFEREVSLFQGKFVRLVVNYLYKQVSFLFSEEESTSN